MPPVSVQLVGADQPLSAGKEVALSCIVRGSRPPPVLTWMLDDRMLSEMPALPVSCWIPFFCSFRDELSRNVHNPTPPLRFIMQQSMGEEAKGIIRFTPTAEDRGKRLSCRAKNANLSRTHMESSSELGSSGAYVPELSKEDSRHLVIHGKLRQTKKKRRRWASLF